jgi:hypothetical protein
MKSTLLAFTLTTLTSLALATTAPAVLAQKAAFNPTVANRHPIDGLTPFNLVN